MQQRPTSSSRAPEAENCMMKVTQPPQQQAKYSPRSLRVDISGGQLPLYFRSSNPFRRDYKETLRSRLAAEKLVHVIPVIVLLCLFTLWWFSYPVNLVIKDGKIVATHRFGMPQPFNNNHVELAILVSTISPVTSVPQNFTVSNETEAHPVSKTD
ncbi:hypothetical protein P3X46_000273 [Hevea brasiliensis]|uniref:Uncharacterized protein n=2 Tax=Hevea brasiliensis TaxID=3981 RepID=A0A6A6LHJ9_HEVBR|nr:uncharacterized protein LOC110665119 [Hevea brasiliensis]KAF2300467.1 hypothetical protein GH714_013695 [Hevea brasiliensis]KAF2300474.1 hypothetical protein GH714_013730 [Hevea brasiliensis]KAJ9188923.1 hypothetical protein P3X46_000273 [Hevea brasiliensis]